jgi:hypothetical protein
MVYYIDSHLLDGIDEAELQQVRQAAAAAAVI